MDAGKFTGMSVQNVMTKDVVTIVSSETTRCAWIRMVERDISSAPVLDESGDLVGIVSISDIHRSILAKLRVSEDGQPGDAPEGSYCDGATNGLAAAMKEVTETVVSSVMPEGQNIISIGYLDSIDRAIRIMGEKNVNLLPVLKDGKVAGVLSRQDVIWILSGKPNRRP